MEKITKMRICLIALGVFVWVIALYLSLFPKTVYDANHAHPAIVHPYLIEGFVLLFVGVLLINFGYRYKQRSESSKEPKT
jgi:hypothetical protein